MSDRDGAPANIAFVRAACRTAVLVSWEVVVVLWPLLTLLERLQTGRDTEESGHDR